MTDIQPDLFGGSAVIGASKRVQREEADQCLGQTDVFSQVAEVEELRPHHYWRCDGCWTVLKRHNSRCCVGYGSSRCVGY